MIRNTIDCGIETEAEGHSSLEKLGGHIEIESQLGRGSPFRVVFPQLS